MSHPRCLDWPERLAAFVEQHRRTPFAWGSHDCALFAAAAVQAITGADPLAAWRGTYTTEEEAEAILGGLRMEEFLDAVYRQWGAQPIGAKLAARGDVVVMDVGNLPTCGVHLGGSVAAPGAERLHFLPTRLIRLAWKI